MLWSSWLWVICGRGNIDMMCENLIKEMVGECRLGFKLTGTFKALTLMESCLLPQQIVSPGRCILIWIKASKARVSRI